MQTINSEVQLLSIVRKSNVVIYGAGAVSKALVVYMMNHDTEYVKLNIVVSKFLEGVKIENIPVVGISDISIQWNDAVVIIAAMENKKYEMKDNAENYCENVYILDDDFCMHLRHLAGDRAYDWAWIQNKYGITSLAIKQDVADLHDAMIRLTPQPVLRYLVLNILDHCNLNCKGCDHFAPIAEKREISYKIVENDLRRFSEIMDQDVKIIGIMGGEPLLHPDLPQIIYTARKYFPNSRIQVDTNGLLLLGQDEAFWRSCRENEAVIVNTKYPVNLDYKLIEGVCEKHHVAFEYYGDSGEVQKKLYKIPLDIHGNQDPRNSFAHCFHANNCVTLMEGRLYPCTIAPNVHIFNKKYHTHMELCKEDYIDIYDKDITKHRVLEFLSRPIPFCRFCNVRQRSFGYEWERSRQEITEWVATEHDKFPHEE